MRRGDPSVNPQNFTILARASFSNLASFFWQLTRGRGVERPPASRSCSIHLSEVFHCCLFYFSFFSFSIFPWPEQKKIVHWTLWWAFTHFPCSAFCLAFSLSASNVLPSPLRLWHYCVPPAPGGAMHFARCQRFFLLSPIVASSTSSSLCRKRTLYLISSLLLFTYFAFVSISTSPSVSVSVFSLCFSDKTMRVFPALQPCEDFVFNLCFLFYW